MNQIDKLLMTYNNDPEIVIQGWEDLRMMFKSIMINCALVDNSVFPTINKYISDMTDAEYAFYLKELEAIEISGMSFAEFCSSLQNNTAK